MKSFNKLQMISIFFQKILSQNKHFGPNNPVVVMLSNREMFIGSFLLTPVLWEAKMIPSLIGKAFFFKELEDFF
jgi:hypothetical protein